jgi:hypothetical protein
MSKIELFRFKRRIPGSDDYKTSSRMATLEKINSMKTVELIHGSGITVEANCLIPGEGWTEKNFVPKNSN